MRKIALIIIALGVALSACKQTEYTSYLETMSIDNVTSISLNPNSPVLVADGVAELTFLVKAYMDVENQRVVEMVVSGENVVEEREFTTTTLVKADRLLSENVVISNSRGETVENFKYSTTTGAGTELEFTCTVGNLTSAKCKVKLVAKPTPYTKKIVVPVVFHILSQTSTLTISNAITSEAAGKHLERANKVFGGRQFPKAPATVDSGISFVLATHDPNGNLLKEPGLDRHDFGNDFTYNANQKDYLWDPEKYLNIYVYNSYMNYATGPSSIISSAGGFLGFPDLKKVDDPSEYYYGTSDTQWGILIYVSDFAKLGQAGNSSRFEKLLGNFYGLLQTYHASYLYVNGDVDYCSDTYMYKSVNQSIEKQTWVPAGSTEAPIYYNSFNIMDGSTTSAAITPEQAARMRFVIENCPGRRAGWSK